MANPRRNQDPDGVLDPAKIATQMKPFAGELIADGPPRGEQIRDAAAYPDGIPDPARYLDEDRVSPPWSSLPDVIEDRKAGKVIGHVPVHANDEPFEVLARARALRRGQIPHDKATRFRALAALKVQGPAGGRSVRVIEPGQEFAANEISDKDRQRFYERDAILPIA